MLSDTPKFFMVFDVESIGLHGEGFAFGYVIIDSKAVKHEEGLFSCNPNLCYGTNEGRQWVLSHIAPITVTHSGPIELRSQFYDIWTKWKNRGGVLVADYAWPVESRFLSAMIDDNPDLRSWQGPYPLHELASILYSQNIIAINERLSDELPVHNPLADARQSSRLLVQALKKMTM